MIMQQEIIDELGVQPEIDPKAEITRRVDFLKDYLGKTSLKGYVLGISGGQDSLLAGILAQKAVEELRKGGREAYFHAVLLPYGDQADRDDALLACDFIKPDRQYDWDIKDFVDTGAAGFQQVTGDKLSDFDKGNLKARARMAAQYMLAGAYGLIVIGTDHAAEAVTGFFTKFGDGAADIVPLAGLTKDQGKQMLSALGAPERLYTKAPTADLLDNKPGQTDEAELGLTYSEIDDYLEGKDIPTEAAEKIERRYRTTQHKRALPVALPSNN